MTTLHFTGAKADAARHLYDKTSLGFAPSGFLQFWTDPGGLLTVTVNEGPFSSGEEALLDLLGSISGRTSAFAISDMVLLDAQTRRVAWEAIGIAAGIEGAKDTGRVRVREEPDGRITLIVAGTPLARIRITDRGDHDS